MAREWIIVPHATRYSELEYANVYYDDWRFINVKTNCVIGPRYDTKDDLFADLDRFAFEFGCNGAPRPMDTVNADLLQSLREMIAVFEERIGGPDAQVGASIAWDNARAAVERATGVPYPEFTPREENERRTYA
jgi:hypothetical protein